LLFFVFGPRKFCLAETVRSLSATERMLTSPADVMLAPLATVTVADGVETPTATAREELKALVAALVSASEFRLTLEPTMLVPALTSISATALETARPRTSLF